MSSETFGPLAERLVRWLSDYYLAATPLLLVALLTRRWIRQPVHRLTVAWLVALEMAALAAICALPGWPRIAYFAAGAAKPAAESPAIVDNDAPPPAAGKGDDPNFATPLRKAPARIRTLPTPDAPQESDAPVMPPAPSHVWSWSERVAAAYLAGTAAAGLWLACGAAAAWAIRRRARPASQ